MIECFRLSKYSIVLTTKLHFVLEKLSGTSRSLHINSTEHLRELDFQIIEGQLLVSLIWTTSTTFGIKCITQGVSS